MSFHNASQAITWIHSLTMLGMKPGLKRMNWMLDKLGNPHVGLPFVHIAGTNGKGSVLSFMQHVLQEGGYKVGTFSSPYIIRFQDRVKVNGQDIGDEQLVKIAARLKPLTEQLALTDLGQPTEFEVVTTLAFCYFAEVQPDIVLLEVGLGGRLDSTNVITPIASVITNIGHDHMHILGHKLTDIAYEKAGIIKAGVPVVTGETNRQSLAVLLDKADKEQASLYTYMRPDLAEHAINSSSFWLENQQTKWEEQSFTFKSPFRQYENLSIQMKGTHQLDNVAIALMALQMVEQKLPVYVSEANIAQGLWKTTWPGRLEIIGQDPLTLLDGAHNPQGMQALMQAVEHYFADREVTVYFSAMKDKDLAHMMSCLQGRVSRVILTQFEYPRAALAEELFEQWQQAEELRAIDVQVERDWVAHYDNLRHNRSLEDVILFTGSLYFIAHVRHVLAMM